MKLCELASHKCSDVRLAALKAESDLCSFTETMNAQAKRRPLSVGCSVEVASLLKLVSRMHTTNSVAQVTVSAFRGDRAMLKQGKIYTMSAFKETYPGYPDRDPFTDQHCQVIT